MHTVIEKGSIGTQTKIFCKFCIISNTCLYGMSKVTFLNLFFVNSCKEVGIDFPWFM